MAQKRKDVDITFVARGEHNETRPAHRVAGGTKMVGRSEKSARGKKEKSQHSLKFVYNDR
jgi:hypothetical protein